MQRNFHWLACLKRRGKTCDVFCFDGDNLRVRSQSFDGQGNAGEQTRATHWNDHRVQIGNLLDDFESHRPLAGNDRRIVIPIDVVESFFFRDLVRARPGFSEIFSVKNDGRAKFLTITYFNQRREPRHHHCSRNAEQFALVGKRLSVIARGRGDHATLLLIRRQLGQSVTSAAFLETSGSLQIVEFAENFHARDLTERDGRRTGRIVNRTSDPFARRFDILERDHRVSIYRASKSGNVFAQDLQNGSDLSILIVRGEHFFWSEEISLTLRCCHSPL